MKLRLRDRAVLITGALRGIGAAAAAAFTAEGCRLHLAARSEAGLREVAAAIRAKHDVAIEIHPGDLSVIKKTQDLAAGGGDIDILVNNAGAVPTGPIEAVTDADWRAGFDLKVTFETARFADGRRPRPHPRTKMVVSDEFSAAVPAIRNCRIEAWGRNGVTAASHPKLTRADIERGPSDEEVEGKVLALTGGVLSSRVHGALVEGADRLESIDAVHAFITLTKLDAGRA